MLSHDPLKGGRGTVCLWAFSLPFYVRSAILNRFYTYVKYIPYSMDRDIASQQRSPWQGTCSAHHLRTFLSEKTCVVPNWVHKAAVISPQDIPFILFSAIKPAYSCKDILFTCVSWMSESKLWLQINYTSNYCSWLSGMRQEAYYLR